MNKPDSTPTASAPKSTAPAAPIPARRAYPVEEAMTLLGGICRKSIYDLIKSGELATVKIAGRRLVPDESINALLSTKLAEQKAGAA